MVFTLSMTLVFTIVAFIFMAFFAVVFFPGMGGMPVKFFMSVMAPAKIFETWRKSFPLYPNTMFQKKINTNFSVKVKRESRKISIPGLCPVTMCRRPGWWSGLSNQVITQRAQYYDQY